MVVEYLMNSETQIINTELMWTLTNYYLEKD